MSTSTHPHHSVVGRKVTPSAPSIPVLSFFTGAGFLDLGFAKAGFETIWSNEFSPQFAKGYEFAMSAMGRADKISNTTSIVELGPNEIGQQAFAGRGKPDVFGIIGGPPCPDFSVGGKNRGHEGDRGKLSQVYVHRILELLPTFFLFENVPGLLRTRKHRLFLQRLLGELAVSYITDIKVLNALDYGVPQDRERVILVGFHRKWLRSAAPAQWLADHSPEALQMTNELELWADKHWFPWNLFKKYDNAKTHFDWPTENAFGTTPPRPQDIPDELMVGPRICNYEETSVLPNGTEHFTPYSARFTQIAEGDVSRKSFKRLHRWRYSPAAAYGNNEVHLHPTCPRRLTVREAMRIQTVPDDYALPPEMTLSHKFKTIGNGVPVALAEAVANTIKAVLKREIWKHST